MKINKGQIGVSFALFLGVGLMLFLTYDIIITNILSAYYCSQPPNPKTYIGKKVEYPISIYWEDNVYPGFSKEDRELMIINYLDGKHLKTMVLNAPDGKVYVYRAKEGEYKAMGYKEKDYAKMIMQRGEVYTKETMPKTNYTVTFNEIPLNSFARKFLYSDETKVIENNTSKVIAYNRRYMRFFYNILPDFEVGGRYYSPHPMCGERVPHLEYKVFNAYQWTGLRFGNHSRNLHEILIKRYKGEE